jgi:hypothetical protein
VRERQPHRYLAIRKALQPVGAEGGLAVRCSTPASTAAAFAADAATVATDPVTTDVDAIDSGPVE